MGEIRPLTGLRGVLAIWVVLAHLWVPTVVLFPSVVKVARPALGGNLTVDTFFVLSGFIVTHVYADRIGGRLTWAGAREFWRNRFARIYPVYFACLVMFVIFGHLASDRTPPPISPLALDAEVVLRNAFFLQSLPGGIVVDPPAWSLPGEVVGYALFPVFVFAVTKISRPAVAFGLAAVIGVAGATLIAITFTDRFGYSLYELSWMRVGWAFPAGCLIGWGWHLLGDRRTGPVWDCVALTGALGVFLAIMLGHPSPTYYMPSAGLPFLLLIVVGCAGSTGMVRRVLSGRLIVWGGRISYSVYLTHYVLVYVYVEVINQRELGDGSLGARLGWLSLTLVAVVALGAAFYHLIEEPARRLIAGDASRRRARLREVTTP